MLRCPPRRMHRAILLTPFLIACSTNAVATSVDSELTVCGKTSGRYITHWEQRPGGTCGGLHDHWIDMESGESKDCTVDLEQDSSCRVRGTIECDGVKNTISCKWSQGGDNAKCVWRVHGADCDSVYDVTYRRPTWEDFLSLR